MKKTILFVLLSFMVGGCNGEKKEKVPALAKLAIADTTYKPKVDVRVNKRYDDKGHLIQYDSTYSYFYSTPGLKHDKSIDSDSLVQGFKDPLSIQSKWLFDRNMNSIFFNDSLYKYDFYNNDYFSKRFQLNMQRFENMFRQMDSLKADMFKRDYPRGEIKKEVKDYFCRQILLRQVVTT